MDYFIAMLALLAISLFWIVRFQLNAAIAPFFSLATVVLWMCMICMTGLVVAGVWLVFIFAAFCLVYVFVLSKRPLKEIARAFFQPGMVFFIAVSVFFFIALKLKNPWFAIWDEFSFWGIAAKAIFTNRQIYTLFTSSMINFSYPPALPLISFFFQFFGRTFMEWKVFLAYDILIMSVMSMLFARVRWKNALTALIVAFFSLASLYMFWQCFEGRVLYVDAYADTPIGVVFGGVLLAWFFSEENSRLRWAVALVGVMLLTFIKDIGFALGLVASVVIAFDMLLAGHLPGKKPQKKWRRPLRLGYPLALVAGVLCCYFLWALHFNSATSLSRLPDPYAYSALEILTGKDPYFIEILKLMWQALFKIQIVNFGTMFEMCMLFTAIPVVVGALTGKGRRFLRLLAFSLLMLAGFALYYIFHAYMYTAIYREHNYDLINITRYISSYSIGWMIAVAGVSLYEIAAPLFKKMNLAVGSAVAVFLLFAGFHYLNHHPDQYVFTSYKVDTGMPGIREAILKDARKYLPALTKEDRIYFVCQQSDGGEWFVFAYDFMPAYTLPVYKGGNFVSPGLDTVIDSVTGSPVIVGETRYDIGVDRELFVEILRKNEIDYVYVLKLDDYFYSEFSPLFSDGLMEVYDHTNNMYMVVDGGENFLLVSVYNAESIAYRKAEYQIP